MADFANSLRGRSAIGTRSTTSASTPGSSSFSLYENTSARSRLAFVRPGAILGGVERSPSRAPLCPISRKTMSRTKRSRTAPNVAQRRVLVAKYLARRWKQSEIAKELGVHEGTISRDAAILRKQWAESMGDDIAKHISRELADLEAMERDAADEYFAQPLGKRHTKWIHVRLKCKEHRAKLLGLDAAHDEARAARAAAAAVAAVEAVQQQVEEMSPDELVAAYQDTVIH